MPTEGSVLKLTAEPDSIYSLTTTTGQGKGTAVSPPSASFPPKYREDFASYPNNLTPKYWSDLGGAFEVVSRSDGKGKALRQVLVKQGIQWCPSPTPQSICGDANWEDYTIGADVLIEQSGYVSLFGRIATAGWSAGPPNGYGLHISDTGHWNLQAVTKQLAEGKVQFPADSWHQLKLAIVENKITATIDGTVVAEIKDDQFDHGNAGIGCGWNHAQFANIVIDSDPHPSRVDLAAAKPASASSQWSTAFAADKATAADPTSRWNAAGDKSAGEWLEVDLGQRVPFNRTIIRQFDDRITKYKIEYSDGGEWRTAFEGGPMHAVQRDTFPAVIASKVRLFVVETKSGQPPSIYKLRVFNMKTN